MKNINFITTLSPQQQYEIRRWFICSMLIVIFTLIAIGFFIIPQLHALYAMKQEITALEKKTKDYAQLTSTKDTLKKENETLQKKRAHLTKYLNQPSNPHTYLAAIINSCSTDVQLEQVRKNKKDLEITALFSTPESATIMIQKLSDTDLFATLKLTSLQHDTQTKKFRCTIKGKIRN